MELASLQTRGARLAVIACLTLAIYVVPYQTLEHARLSLYERAGIPSPSIGLTRAYWKLIHGDPIGAWERNKLIYLVMLVLCVMFIHDWFMPFLKKRSEEPQA